MTGRIDTIIHEYEERNINYRIFSSLPAVLVAIKTKEPLADYDGTIINITERILDPLFRFITEDMPELGYETSEALASAVDAGKTAERQLNSDAHEKSLSVRKAKADEFALRMKQEIEQLKTEANVSTYRDIVEVLNDRNIPTSQEGGKWHLGTLQGVLKRAERIEAERQGKSIISR